MAHQEKTWYVHTTDDCVYSFSLPGTHTPFQVAHTQSRAISEGVKSALELVQSMYHLAFTEDPIEQPIEPKEVDTPEITSEDESSASVVSRITPIRIE